MGKAKDIVLKPIDRNTANALVKRVHYSGKVVQNSQIHIGVFYHGELEGAMQFGPSLDKRKLMGLVKGTKWNEFIEFNRMAFTDRLPRNSESRAIAVAMRLLRKHAPHLKWVISFADAAQCGDGTIYRASGFVLTGITENRTLWELPDGRRVQDILFSTSRRSRIAQEMGKPDDMPKIAFLKQQGAQRCEGYQLRYIYFLDKSYRDRLTVPEIPYERIWEVGAGMYRGEKYGEQRAAEATK